MQIFIYFGLPVEMDNRSVNVRPVVRNIENVKLYMPCLCAFLCECSETSRGSFCLSQGTVLKAAV